MNDTRRPLVRELHPKVRPGRAYLLLGLFDVVIVGTVLALGFAAGAVPTLGELGPVATALTALVALNVGVVTINQKRVADARAAWWERARWALEQSTGDNERSQTAGQLALAHLAQSDLATEDDLQLLAAIPDSVIARVEHVAADRMEQNIRVLVVDIVDGVDPFEEGMRDAGPDEPTGPSKEVETP